MKLMHKKNGEAKDVTVVREDPFDSLFNRWFHAVLPFESRLPETFRRPGFPPMDVSEEEGAYVVCLHAPGLDEDDFEIKIMGKQLEISGERKWEKEKKDKEYHRVESQYGAFERMLVLPEDSRLDPDAIDATYKKGVLTVRIPKVEPTPAKKIAVKGEN